MRTHQTKPSVVQPSQTVPDWRCENAPNVTLQDTIVLLCDWHGKLVWKSASGDRLQHGDYLWKGATKPSAEALRSAVARVATLRENCTIEVENDRGEYYRVWMWPLNEPEAAQCGDVSRDSRQSHVQSMSEIGDPRRLAESGKRIQHLCRYVNSPYAVVVLVLARLGGALLARGRRSAHFVLH